jgi:hypothetical protein
VRRFDGSRLIVFFIKSRIVSSPASGHVENRLYGVMSTISFLPWYRQDFSVDELVTDMLQNSFQAFRVATLNKPGVLIVSLLEVHLVIVLPEIFIRLTYDLACHGEEALPRCCVVVFAISTMSPDENTLHGLLSSPLKCASVLR